MPEYCCHIYGQAPNGEPTELFHTHVEAPLVELAYPQVMIKAARQNVDLRTATAVSMEYLLPLDAKELADYDAFRASLHTAPATQETSPPPGSSVH